MTNANDPRVADDARVLEREVFEFVLSNELKRAVGSQNFVTLVVFEPVMGAGGVDGEPAAAAREVARLVGREVRETDLLALTGHGQLSVALLDADLQNAANVIDRVMARLKDNEFERPLAFDVGAACCPTHAADPALLKQAAQARPLPLRRSTI